jgi:hypothetical protein
MRSGWEISASLLKHRLPSGREIRLAYFACLVPPVGWSTFRTLNDGLEVWSRQMHAWDVIGVIAYVQAFALFESSVIFLPLLLLSLLLPSHWLRGKFVELSTGIVYVSAVWFGFGQFHDAALRWWSFRQLLPWFGAYCVSILLISILIHRSSKVQVFIRSFVERVAPVAAAYLLIAMAAVPIILIRNL